MKRTVLVFGLISGLVSSLMMLVTVPFSESIGFDKAAVLGYTTIVLSFLLIFFGIRSYREQVGGGAVSFGRGLAIGLLITLISSACYVAAWEAVSYKFFPDFADRFAAHMVAEARASGASAEAIAAAERDADMFKASYNNPLMNVAMTFVEPFPIGVLVTLVSAAALRRKRAA